MKIIYTKRFPPANYLAINLFGIVFAKNVVKTLSDDAKICIFNHEAIHTAQMKELLYIPFYLIYGVEFLIKLIKFRDWHKAYLNTSFEREAYANETRLDYTETRKHFAQWKK